MYREMKPLTLDIRGLGGGGGEGGGVVWMAHEQKKESFQVSKRV